MISVLFNFGIMPALSLLINWVLSLNVHFSVMFQSEVVSVMCVRACDSDSDISYEFRVHSCRDIFCEGFGSINSDL